jgi:pimeloyl-ACP methyl ester carboxylesterase
VHGFVDTRWGRFSYCSAGPGDRADPARPAVVLLHDPELSHTAFSPLVPLLSQHFRVVTLDAPSAVPCSAPGPVPAAEAFAQALGALGLDQVVLYGVRTGGRVAIQLSGLARRPSVAGLVLSGVPLDPDGAGRLWARRPPRCCCCRTRSTRCSAPTAGWPGPSRGPGR